MSDQIDGDLITDTQDPPATADLQQGDGQAAVDGGSPPSADQQPADLVGEGTDDKNTADPLSGDGSGGEEGVPDEYAFEPPEGVEMTDDLKAALDGFSETAKELGLTQAQYQKLVEYDFNRSQQAADKAVEGWNQRVQSWRDGVQLDKEIGGEKLPETMKTVEAVMKQFGDAELRSLLRSPSSDNPEGLAVGNHPAVVRFLNRVGKAIADPTLLEGGAAPQTDGQLKRLYPSMFDQST